MSVMITTALYDIPDTDLVKGSMVTWVESDDVRQNDLAIVEIGPSRVLAIRHVRNVRGNKIRLSPKNRKFPSTTLPRKQVTVLGYVVNVAEPSAYQGVAGLRIRGDGFRDAHLNDGDILTYTVSGAAKPGDSIVGYLVAKRKTVVKVYWPEGGQVRLAAFNPRYPNIVVPNDDLVILGMVTAVTRQF